MKSLYNKHCSSSSAGCLYLHTEQQQHRKQTPPRAGRTWKRPREPHGHSGCCRPGKLPQEDGDSLGGGVGGLSALWVHQTYCCHQGFKRLRLNYHQFGGTGRVRTTERESFCIKLPGSAPGSKRRRANRGGPHSAPVRTPTELRLALPPPPSPCPTSGSRFILLNPQSKSVLRWEKQTLESGSHAGRETSECCL